MSGRGRGRGRGRDGYGRSPPRRRRSPPSDSREMPYCMFCKTQLSSKRAYKEHQSSVVHKQKETLISKALSDGLHYCYTCEKVFPSKVELDTHCLMSRHQPLYRVEGLEVQKEPEPVPVPELARTDRERRREDDERDRQKIVLKLTDLREEDGTPQRNYNNKKFYCAICSIDCLNDGNYKAHMQSWRHRAETDKKREADLKKKVEQEFQKIDGDDVVDTKDDSKMQVPSHLNNDVGHRYWCELCSLAMLDDVAYLQHVHGRKHLRVVSQMKRPYKCYVCHMNFTVEKEFNHHLEGKAHMVKAFKKTENVEAKRSSHRDEKKREDSSGHERKIEIVRSPVGSEDLRDKLQGKTNIVITKTNTGASNNTKNEKPHLHGPKLPALSESDRKTADRNKRAKEMEFAAKFKKLVREFGNNMVGLKERLTHDREKDIFTYQQFESTYTKLCNEEDYVRENIRVLDEGDPRKEEYIRDMIRIQSDMREVRQELEIREMMIIKREELFRQKFPDIDNTVVIKPQQQGNKDEDGQDGKKDQEPNNIASSTPNQLTKSESSDSDLRIQLERERLLKRLGPELNNLDPSLKEKLLSAIMDEKKEAAKNSATKNPDAKKKQMALLTEREKELQKELAALKSNVPKKITKSLVPQYDDVDDKKKLAKKRSGRRSRSESSDSSDSSSGSSDDESRKSSKRRRHSPSPRRKSSDRSRRKRSRRSSSRDRDGRRKKSSRRDNDRRKKSDKKKSVKMTIKGKAPNKVNHSVNPLEESSSHSDEDVQEVPPPQVAEEQTPLPSSSNVISIISGGALSVSTSNQERPFFAQSLPRQQQQQQHQHQQQQKREQFSLWKNPAANVGPVAKVSPKEDVWDIAFSGARTEEEQEKDDPLSKLFNSKADSPKMLPDQILNILRSVAPAIQKVSNEPPPQHQHQPSYQPQQFPVTIPKESERPISSFPSYGRSEYFDKPSTANQLPVTPEASSSETSGGRIRSILKKMKDPTPTMPISTALKETNVPGFTSYSNSNTKMVIPGLESPAVLAKENRNSSLFPPSVMPLNSSPNKYQEDVHIQPVTDYKPATTRPITDTPGSQTSTDSYNRYTSPGGTTSNVNSKPYNDYYSEKPPQERYPASPPQTREREPHQAGVRDPPPTRDRQPPYDDRQSQQGYPIRRLSPPPAVTSYERDVENYRKLEENRPPLRRDPYAPREPLPLPNTGGREHLPPPGRRDFLPPPGREPPMRSSEPLVPPVKRAEETDDEFYSRFEKYYEEKRRREAAEFVSREYSSPR